MKNTSTIYHDDYDAAAYTETLSMYPRMRETVEAHAEALPTASDLVSDVFYSMYRPAPQLVPAEELAPSASINRTILEEMMGTTQWESVRAAGTVGDQLYSAIATATVAMAVLSSLDKKIIERLKQLHEAEQEAQRLFDQAETLEDLAGNTSGDKAQSLYDQAQKAREQAEEQQQEAKAIAGDLAQDSEQIEDAARQSARAALQTAEGDIEANEAAVKAFSGGYSQSGGNSNGSMTLKEKIKLAQNVGKSTKLKQVAELCGRMTRIALAVQKSKIKHPPDEIVGIEIGKDLGRVLPVELAQLSDPDLEPLFFKKYVEGQLMQLEMIGHEKQGHGPIIVALDSSHSMTDPLGAGFSKEVWSKAVTLALLAVARKQKRDLAVIHFAENGKLKVFTFPKGEGTPQQLISNTEFFYNGGTQYEGWMREALKLVQESKFNKADVICVSDGLVNIPSQLEADWNRQRKAREMRCYSVLLGDQSGENTLARISDALTTIDDLKADNDALQMMFAV
jgi:uncharacterized protein with von Willebrand factor type A (vWA) domain